jgi:hypothetical protein
MWQVGWNMTVHITYFMSYKSNECIQLPLDRQGDVPVLSVSTDITIHGYESLEDEARNKRSIAF